MKSGEDTQVSFGEQSARIEGICTHADLRKVSTFATSASIIACRSGIDGEVETPARPGPQSLLLPGQEQGDLFLFRRVGVVPDDLHRTRGQKVAET